jgi:hypothetical protein
VPIGTHQADGASALSVSADHIQDLGHCKWSLQADLYRTYSLCQCCSLLSGWVFGALSLCRPHFQDLGHCKWILQADLYWTTLVSILQSSQLMNLLWVLPLWTSGTWETAGRNPHGTGGNPALAIGTRICIISRVFWSLVVVATCHTGALRYTGAWW